MDKNSITTGFGIALALCLVLAPATAQETDAAAEPPAATAAEPALLEQLGVDARPSEELGVEELKGRIDTLAALLEQGGLADDAREQVNTLLLTDKLELEKREAAAAQPAEPASEPAPAAEATPPATDQPAAPATEPSQPTAEETAPPAPEPAVEAATDVPPPPTIEPPATTAEQPAPSTAAPAQPAADAGTAAGTESTPPEQPAAATAEPPTAPAEQPAATAAPEQPATTTEAAPAQPAPPSVEAPPAVSAEAETKAAALLADKTAPEALSDEALKARVEQSRALLDEPELSRKTAKALRQRLKTDRQALRARVAAQEAAEAAAEEQAKAASQQPAAPEEPAAQKQTQPTQTQQTQTQQTQAQQTQPSVTAAPQSKQQPQQALAPQSGAAAEDAPLEIAPLLPLVIAPTLAEIPLLLQDRRPAQDLADAELNRRIVAHREALQDEQAYSEDDLTLFDRQLRQDRQELNNRLLADRNERAQVYQEWTNPNVEINTEPEPGEPQAPNSIFAAEVGDEEMWDQLVAAPLEPLPRRYSRHQMVEEPEFIMNLPDVRESMPSIELDTITFGFNEAFVREEEIFDLDRIARMIERLVAAHPDEIFMIEGHTDAVGSDAYNLRLSRQRAEAVKAALTLYYVIPPETLATVGLGEHYLKIWTPEAEEENRRVTVRRVTPLVAGYAEEE